MCEVINRDVNRVVRIHPITWVLFK